MHILFTTHDRHHKWTHQFLTYPVCVFIYRISKVASSPTTGACNCSLPRTTQADVQGRPGIVRLCQHWLTLAVIVTVSLHCNYRWMPLFFTSQSAGYLCRALPVFKKKEKWSPIYLQESALGMAKTEDFFKQFRFQVIQVLNEWRHKIVWKSDKFICSDHLFFFIALMEEWCLGVYFSISMFDSSTCLVWEGKWLDIVAAVIYDLCYVASFMLGGKALLYIVWSKMDHQRLLPCMT